MSYQQINIDDTLIRIIIRFYLNYDVKNDFIERMNELKVNDQLTSNILKILKMTPRNLNTILNRFLGSTTRLGVIIDNNAKYKLDLFIISNISSNTAGNLLHEFNNILIVKETIKQRTIDYDTSFYIKFLTIGLKNNNFLNQVKANIHILDPFIVYVLMKICAAIRIVYIEENFNKVLTTNKLKKKIKDFFPIELVKNILNEADSSLFLKKEESQKERQKITNIQKKLDKLFRILRDGIQNTETVSSQSSSNSFGNLDEKDFQAYKLFYHVLKYDKVEVNLMTSFNKVDCDKNVQKFSVKEFDTYLNSSPEKHFIRKFKDDKCYEFTSEQFTWLYDFD